MIERLGSKYVQFLAGPNESRAERIHITLNYMGLLFLNRKAFGLLGHPDAVAVFFNEQDSKIAVSATHRRQRGAFPVFSNGKGAYYTVRLSPFCRHFGIRIDTTEKFVDPEFDSKGLLLLDLKSTIKVSGVRRKKKTK